MKSRPDGAADHRPGVRSRILATGRLERACLGDGVVRKGADRTPPQAGSFAARIAAAGSGGRGGSFQAGSATTTFPVTWSPSRLRPRSEISIVPACSSRPVTEPSRVIVSPG